MALNFNGTDVGTLKMGTTDIANAKFGSTDIYNSRIVIPQLSGLNAICADSSGNSLYAMLGKEYQTTSSSNTKVKHVDILIYKLNNSTKQWEEYTKLVNVASSSSYSTYKLLGNAISRSLSVKDYSKVKTVDGHSIQFYISNYIFSRNSAYIYYLECGTYRSGNVSNIITNYVNIIRYNISTKTETTIKSEQYSGRIYNGTDYDGVIEVKPEYIYFINDNVIAATFTTRNGHGSISTMTNSINYISTNTSIVNERSFIIKEYDTYNNLKDYAVLPSTIYDETSASNYGGFAYYSHNRYTSGMYYLYYTSKKSKSTYITTDLLIGTQISQSIWDAKSTFKYKYKGSYIEYPGVSPCIFKGDLVCLNPSGKICQYNGDTWIVNGVEQDHF